MVELDPQKHLQNILMSAACATEMSDPTTTVDKNLSILLLKQDKVRKEYLRAEVQHYIS